ncbi:beta/alpha barrel domain-containing protein [Parafilimonas terrae]|uniref:Hydroxymethylglutaryl-CoA lyase n=1 Tax=Parafilimonas terrae TaxID=1465490 RepID=A0A1I5SMZ9_9BACT|nr:hydroxymethylglutaryl-CoA lyase [Parafilimonas terrae]SFP71897.1 hydroxymethylglutaryl-CoA lyase [Parafilimonas terrae]
MDNAVKLIECPRDAMQGWRAFIPTQQKINYINSLLQVGFDTIDFGSFVSPKAIPQMADTKEVIEHLELGNTKTKLLAIIANERGAKEAAEYDVITYLGFPFSISPTFQQRNTNSTIEESLQRVEAIQSVCIQHSKTLVVYLSMAFGNPYGDTYNEDILLHWADALVQRDIKIISLADTIGIATPEQIKTACATLIQKYASIEIGVHLHSSAHNRKEKLNAAFNAGCLRFDGALKGIGGCPMAQDKLVGNMDTLYLIEYFKQKNVTGKLNEEALQKSIAIANEIFI